MCRFYAAKRDRFSESCKGMAADVGDLADWGLDRGEFDLVAVGRVLISDPEWARRSSDLSRKGSKRGEWTMCPLSRLMMQLPSFRAENTRSQRSQRIHI
jgi:2,4-dienoyl-CoA reductase-like NADH-dependent reductase (Old Yellow Enzyme family)